MQGDDPEDVIFSADVEMDSGRYLIEIPSKELMSEVGSGDTYRVAIVSEDTEDTTRGEQAGSIPRSRKRRGEGQTTERTAPVSIDETLRVKIEADGNRGDGVAKVSGGFVVFVPGTSVGEKALVRITGVEGTYARAEVVKRLG